MKSVETCYWISYTMVTNARTESTPGSTGIGGITARPPAARNAAFDVP